MVVRKSRTSVAILANGDPRDPNVWSGTPLHMLQALEQQFDVRLVVAERWPRWYRPLGRALKLFSGGRFAYSWSRFYSAQAARRTNARLRQAAPDVVIAIAATDIAHLLPQGLPLICIGDAVIPELVTYYDMYRQLPPRVQIAARRAEEEAFDRSLMVHLPSRWGIDTARQHYGLPASKLVEVAWGANISLKRRDPRSTGAGPVKLLFVGTDWHRKGGPIALATVQSLNMRGVRCELDVVGCEKPDGLRHTEQVRFHGFVDKESGEGQARLAALYAAASLFFLPTTAEAYGIVFAEAAHHGLPAVAFATGGVTSVVCNEETGILLPVGASPDQFAAAIETLMSDAPRYARMSEVALADARDRLNWEVWGARIEAAVHERLKASTSAV